MVVATLQSQWQARLQQECPGQSEVTQQAIIAWLLGETAERLNELDTVQLALARQAMNYRYQILLQRYLGQGPQAAYQNLLKRLTGLFLIRAKIRTWVDQSRDRQRSIMDVLTEVLQEMLQSDRYLRQQMNWLSQCTTNPTLRNQLLFASLEEYCLRPIRNQPLLVYRFVNYLNRTQKGGLTQMPAGTLVRLISDEITTDTEEGTISLFDEQAADQHQAEQTWQDLQLQRQLVLQEFEHYLLQQLDSQAVEWLRLHLQGISQEQIAQKLNVPIKQVYRLREKISYHAVRVFAVKVQPELVANWLGTSLADHRLGLTPEQWQHFWTQLDATQQQIITALQHGLEPKAIAAELNWKSNQVTAEWTRLYLAAQTLRNTAE